MTNELLKVYGFEGPWTFEGPLNGAKILKAFYRAVSFKKFEDDSMVFYRKKVLKVFFSTKSF